jgi:hypothetical protein
VIFLTLVVVLTSMMMGCDRAAVETWLAEGASGDRGPSLLTKEPLDQARGAFEKRVGKGIQALSLLVYPDHAVLQAQNPRHVSRVEQWIYRRGVVSDPVPVELLGTGKLADNLFPLDDTKLAALPDLVIAARKKANIPEGVVARVLIKRNLPDSVDIRFRVFVTSQRRDGFVEADAQGKIIEAPQEATP